MNKLNIFLLGVLIASLIIPTASAFSTSTFNNSLSSELLVFGSPGSYIRYLAVPPSTLVTVGNINLSYPINIQSGDLGLVKRYYKFDETSGTNALDSVSFQNGTLVGTVLVNKPGIINTGYNITRPGDNIVNITNHGADCADYNCTVSMWINGTNAGTQAVFVEGVNSTTSWVVFGINFLTSGTPVVRLSGSNGAQQDITVPSTIRVSPTNYWQHLVFEMNKTSVLIYVNGTLINQSVITVPANAGTQKFTNLGGDEGIGSFGPFGGAMDEVGMWNMTLNATDVARLYNNGAAYPLGSFYPNGPAPGVLNLSIGEDGVTNVAIGNGSTNTSIFVTGLSSTINNYVSTCTFIAGFCNVPFNFTSSVSGSFVLYNLLNFSNENFIENGQNFSMNTTSGSSESFTINISYDPNYFTSIIPTLVYNSTSYSPVSNIIGGNYIFNATLIAPQTNVQVVKPFYWSFVLTNSSGAISYFNSTSHNQTVSPFLIDDCSTNTQQILNFTMFDEDSKENINGTIETTTNIYSFGTTIPVATANQTHAYTIKSPARVCISPLSAGSQYSGSYEVKYYGNQSTGANQYAVEYKFAQNFSITSSSAVQDIALYDLLDSRSTEFSLTLQSADLSVVKGAVIDIQRQYVPINQFISVESPLTDNFGSAIAHLVSSQVYYNFVVTKQGQLLGTFNNYQVQCQNQVTGDCRITLNLVQSTGNLPDFTNYGNISTNVSLNLAARQLYFNFISADGNSHNVGWNVTLLNNFGNTSICSNFQTGTSGSFTCPIAVTYGNTTIAADLYSDSQYLGRSIFSLQPTGEDIFGGTRVVIGLVMYSMLGLLMMGNPASIIIGSILGMGFVIAFHLVDAAAPSGATVLGNFTILLWFVIAGAIILYYMRNKT